MSDVVPQNADANADRLTRLRFMRITPETSGLLRTFWPAVESALTPILDEFYRHATSEPVLVRMIGNEVPRLKLAQKAHWGRLFSGRFDDAYVEGVRTIGRMHHKIGLEPRWYIAGYNLVLCKLHELAMKSYRRDPGKLNAAVAAVNSAVMLDMDIAISTYVEALLAERQAHQEKLTREIAAFDTKAEAALDAVAAAAGRLQSTANALTANAQQSSQQSTAVAAASEQASANVQTVASAAEELAASVSEISR